MGCSFDNLLMVEKNSKINMERFGHSGLENTNSFCPAICIQISYQRFKYALQNKDFLQAAPLKRT